MKSKANTMSDLATSGALMMGLAKNMAGGLKRNTNEGNEDDKKAAEGAQKRNANRRNKAKEDANAVAASLDEKPEDNNTSYGEYQGEAREPAGVSSTNFDGQKAKDAVLGAAMKRRLKKGMATRAIKFSAGVVGGTAMATAAIADGKSGPGAAIAGYVAGKSLGQTVTAPLAFGANKLEQAYRGREISKAIEAGAFDGAAGLGAISNGDAADFMNSSEFEDKKPSRQEIYRKALAEYAKVAASGGETKAEIAYYDYLEKNLKSN